MDEMVYINSVQIAPRDWDGTVTGKKHIFHSNTECHPKLMERKGVDILCQSIPFHVLNFVLKILYLRYFLLIN